MATTNEPRALQAALAAPAFVSKVGGSALHAADRHVDRWAPEVGATGANRIRPLRNLGFVDRLVSPWIESAQRSASLRMFSQYVSTGAPERPASNVSWLFPRPWYQDELDWMAAARHVNVQTQVSDAPAPTMFTTRGTYVPPSRVALPAQLHEYVAPSLSIARPDVAVTANAYSPLVPFAAAQAAQVMSTAIAPLVARQQAPNALSPNLRAVLQTMLQRSAAASTVEPTRISNHAPELVTPPAPRPEPVASSDDAPMSTSSKQATQAAVIAERYAEQRARIAELQRVARVAAEREQAARAIAPEATAARIAERQAEIQQRAAELSARREAEARQTDARREAATNADRLSAAEAERARLEERIAQRLAQRTREAESQRLHETAREAAARDARIAAATPIAPAETRAAAAAAPSQARVAAELAGAVAALPPELAAMVASSISGRPDRAAQAIAELGEALRTVELLARTTATGGAIAPVHGPRVVMPAGLGGLVATVERTSSTSATAARMPMPFAAPAAPAIGQAAQPAATAAIPFARTDARVPTLTFVSPARAASPTATVAPTSALGAALHATPAALNHVAWSDRWLARFAGAQPQSLDVFTAASASESRMSLLASSAPGTIYVAPELEAPRPEPRAEAPAAAATASRSDQVVRYDDSAETPDDVFFAIAAASASSRTRPAAKAAAPAPIASTAASFEPITAPARETLADLVAHAAPTAPGAGLAAGLASSPFAQAIRHVLPLGAAPTFDVRALFGSAVGATYLAGLLASPTDEIAIARAMPSWAMPDQMTVGEMETSRDVAAFSPTYVAPVDPTVEAGDAGVGIGAAQAAAAAAPLTTIRSALLSFDVDTVAAGTAATPAAAAASTTFAPSTPSYARSLVESLSLPLLADAAAMRDLGTVDVAGTTAQVPSYASPGMIAERAHAWSVATERSTADLSFDFVPPELVLAARVYGLGPAEAAQAARLAIAGPGSLSAMAGAVDRTFVQAMAIEAERRSGRSRIETAYPMVATADGAPDARELGATPTATGAAAAAPTAFTPTASAFGVERRTPRGAFLWPSATTAALGLNAPTPDGNQAMSVAALELLAAQAVAELGTFAALGETTETERAALASVASRATDGAAVTTSVASSLAGVSSAQAEARDEDILASASAFVPASRRDKFHALYVALSQSPSGRTASPAARAARALALAGRGEDTISARERASVAWDVLPVVYAQSTDDGESSLSTGEAAARQARRREELRAMDPTYVDVRPGLGQLSARAGEALGSYVAPATASSASSSSSSSSSERHRGDMGAVMRAPTAAQELVQTGGRRHGGGDFEIPAWFEQAAKRMLAERTGIAGDISLAELTYVTTAPAPQIAAASRTVGASASSSMSPAPSDAPGAGADKAKVDIEKLANDVYREVLVLMDIARARNGEPYL